MRPNNFLVTQNMKTVIKGPFGKEVVQESQPNTVQCHFLHNEGELVAALSHCSEDDIVRQFPYLRSHGIGREREKKKIVSETFETIIKKSV